MAVRRHMSGGLVAAAAGLGVVVPLVLAGSASAHVPTWSVHCDKISVALTSYNPDHQNTVSLTVDGEKLLDAKKFGASFSQTFVVKAHTKDIKAVLAVVTDEDPKGAKGWTVTKTETIAPCEQPPTTPPPSHSPTTPPPSQSATPTPTVKGTGSAPATPSPTPTGPQLASTGGGGDTPLIAGAGAAVIAIGGGLLFVNRRRQSRRH